MALKGKALVGATKIVAGAYVFGIFAATAFADIAKRDIAIDIAGNFPMPNVQVSTSATAAPVITYQFAGLDDMRKHYPKEANANNWAVCNID